MAQAGSYGHWLDESLTMVCLVLSALAADGYSYILAVTVAGMCQTGCRLRSNATGAASVLPLSHILVLRHQCVLSGRTRHSGRGSRSHGSAVTDGTHRSVRRHTRLCSMYCLQSTCEPVDPHPTDRIDREGMHNLASMHAVDC